MRAAVTSAAFAFLTSSRLRSSSPTRLPSLRFPLRSRHLATMAAAASSFRTEAARSPPDVEPPAPPLSKFKVALCQLSVTADKARNIAPARAAIESAAADGAKLVLLPDITSEKDEKSRSSIPQAFSTEEASRISDALYYYE